MVAKRTPPNYVRSRDQVDTGIYRDCVMYGTVDSFIGKSENGLLVYNVVPDADPEALVKVQEIDAFPMLIGDWIGYVFFFLGGYVGMPILDSPQ